MIVRGRVDYGGIKKEKRKYENEIKKRK